MLTIAVTAAVTGVASTAGAWAFNQLSNLRHKTRDLQNRIVALEAKKT